MLKRSVIAADITNLTDARYFAARGVDFLLFNLKDISVTEVMSIAEWVEGVKILVQMDEENIHLIEEVLLRISPFAVGSAENSCLDRILQYKTEGATYHLFPKEEEENAKIIITNVENIDQSTYHILPGSEVSAFSEINPSLESLDTFLQSNEAGIILTGSAEIETGLKSFDHIDLLLDALEKD